MSAARSGVRLRSVQVLLAMLAVGVTAGVVLAALGGGAGPAQPQPTAPAGTETPSPVPQGERMPGVPERPIGELATFERPATANANRQLDYEPSGAPSVEFPDGLGGLDAYATQPVAWRSCGGNTAHCATVLVPLDWEQPDGPALEIAVRRYAGADGSLGPLFVNPGGPGFGGQDFAGYLSQKDWDEYDVVGWDPRGTGESTTVRCGTTEQTDAVFDLDQSPDDDAEALALREGYIDFAQQCRDASGDLLDHLSTIENVRDLDLLRHLLGAEKLNFVGVSYGTFVGAVYAELFPHSVGRLVLDAAVDITDDEDPTPQVAGFELALRNWAAWCSEADDCVFDGSADEIMTQLGDWFQHLDENPVAVGDRFLTQTHAAVGVASYLYEDEQAYPFLDDAIAAAKEERDGSSLLNAADALNGRTPTGFDTVAFAFPATLCVDMFDEGMAAAPGLWRDSFSLAPVMAPNMGMNYVCEAWTAASAPTLKITAVGAPPILVVGTTGDSATPFEHARRMAEQLESGRLLTFDGAGHGAISADNECLRAGIDDYLLDGVVPQEGMVCS
ncbi:MAG TPA: alpha/beta hydrolase [Arachnia sp.]|nr:alpha/beta hydrolase [Arachnia sp.]HMT86646.1 alpha/beta hydrolase [Arachnia sp.]